MCHCLVLDHDTIVLAVLFQDTPGGKNSDSNCEESDRHANHDKYERVNLLFYDSCLTLDFLHLSDDFSLFDGSRLVSIIRREHFSNHLFDCFDLTFVQRFLL